MRSGITKAYKHPKATTLYITIPADVVKDSRFPFKKGDMLVVTISEDFEGLKVTKLE